MKNKVKIDYIIPTWNSEKTIEPCLKALTKYGNPEKIIIVDNKSEDQTVNIAKKYGCKIIYDTRSLGSARIKGLKEATTEWIGFVDSDVVISENWYSTIIKYIDEKAGAIQGRKLTVMDTFRKIEAKKIEKTFKNGAYTIHRGERGYTDNTFIRREVALLADIENINAFEDFIITQTILENGYDWICVPVFSDHYENWNVFIKKSGWHSSGLRYLLKNNNISLSDFLKIFLKYDAWYLIDGITSFDIYYLKTRLSQLKYHWMGLIQPDKMFKLDRKK